MRTKFIAGNWKMNKNAKEVGDYFDALIPHIKDAKCDVALFVPFVHLERAAMAVRGTQIIIGAQNMHWAAEGAFTGEISPSMIKEAGASYTLIGHSERRQYFGETDQTVNLRTSAALKNGVIPVVCVGETLAQRNEDKTKDILRMQITAAFDGITQEISKLIIAYEPVWAIGTGVTATAEQAEEAIMFIRSVVNELYGMEVAQNMRILYGGSMNERNAAELLTMPNIDGGLIGGASLSADKFAAIVLTASI
jgi:triosephosphate isomerase